MPQVFKINNFSTADSLIVASTVVVMALGFFFSARTLVRAIVDLIKERAPKGAWEWAGTFLILWFVLVAVAARAAIAVAARGGAGASSGMVGVGVPSASSAAVRTSAGKNRAGGWLAVSIIMVFLLPALFVRTILFEQPQRMAVSNSGIELLYRLPWRNLSINWSNISDIQLDRKEYYVQGITKAHNYTIVIDHDGAETRIVTDPWYEDQVNAAYQAAKAKLKDYKGE